MLNFTMNTDKSGELVIVGDFSKLLDLVRYIQSLRGIHAGYTSIKLNGAEQTTPIANPICPYCNCACPTYVHRSQHIGSSHSNVNQLDGRAAPKQTKTTGDTEAETEKIRKVLTLVNNMGGSVIDAMEMLRLL